MKRRLENNTNQNERLYGSMSSQPSAVRHAFTLVELLVVISIISFLAGMFMVAFRTAQREAFDQKTRGTIEKISEVLNQRIEEYESYPVTFMTPIPSSAVPLDPSETSTVLLERARLLALRDIIRMEMPDHPDDIKWTTSWAGANSLDTFLLGYNIAINTGMSLDGTTPLPNFAIPFPSRSRRIMERLSYRNSSGQFPIANWEAKNANAELLYLVVEDSMLNGSPAIEIFAKSEIADTDGDNLKELVDADGQPIQWIRWPTGFGGIARYHPDLLDPYLNLESDPLDRMKADPGYAPFANPSSGPSYRPEAGAFPLVASPGSDGVFGLRFELDAFTSGSITTRSAGDVIWPNSHQPAYGPLRFTDPWYPRDPSLVTGRLGAVFNAKALADDLLNYEGNASSL